MRQIKQIIKRITPDKIWTRLFRIRRFFRKSRKRGYLIKAKIYGLLTAKKRAFPDFLIIGTAKGGTTSLRFFLSQHPQIHIKKGEPNYFNREFNYSKGDLWYRSRFPFRSEVASGDLVGEKTTDYLFNPNAAKRIQKDLPNAKLICLLRNPTERAISDYFMCINEKTEHFPIMGAMRIDRGLYRNRGLYLEQLKRYESYLKKDRLLILSSEEFFANPQKVLKQVFKFLRVDETFKCPDLSPVNVGKNKNLVSNEVYEYLNEYFKPHNQKLYKYLNRNFGW